MRLPGPKRVLKFLLRSFAVAAVSLLVLEGLCRLVQLSNDSMPVDIIADPYLAYRMKPSSNGVSAFGVQFEINASGLRNPEVVIPKPAGVFRILVLGDSITMGYGVPSEAAYSRVLEKLINGRHIEVINAGASGYHAQDFVAFLEHYGLAFEPDMIVCAFTRGDIDPPEKLVIRGGVGYDTGQNVTWIPPFVKKALRHSRLYLAIGRARGALGHQAPERSEKARNDAFLEQWPAAQAPLKRLVALTEEHHLPLVLAYLPVQVEVIRGVEYPSLVEQLAQLGTNNFRFINVQPVFVAEKNIGGLYLPLDPAHPTALGHRIIARTIFDDPFFRAALPSGTKFTAQ